MPVVGRASALVPHTCSLHFLWGGFQRIDRQVQAIACRCGVPAFLSLVLINVTRSSLSSHDLRMECI